MNATLGAQESLVKIKNPGIQFETVVAEIQAQIDPKAVVTHDRVLTDRIGQNRQFDVVIEGKFAGQDILGIIECKDLNRRVGTPAIDAFVTKSQDINANFKVIVSKNGFTKPAVDKAKHYGIQTFSLLPADGSNLGFKVGNYWHADVYYWEQISLTLLFVDEPDHKVVFDAQDVRISNQKIIDWFTNYLVCNHLTETETGWVALFGGYFDEHQLVQISESESYLCNGLEFRAKRGLLKKQLFVGINGTGFYDWQKSQATVPPKTEIVTDAVPTDFTEWEDRESDDLDNSGFISIKIIAHVAQFEQVDDVIDLDSL